MKKLILFIGVCVLIADSFWYYNKPVSIPQTVVITEPTPTQKPQVSLTKLKTVTSTGIAAAQTSFTGTTIPTTITQISVYRLDYEVDKMPVSAKVYIPDNSGDYPLFVFGAGTTGLAPKCAPSLENMAVENIGNYENHMIAQAAEGYIAVIPDYAQTYFVSQAESQVLIGAIKNLLEVRPSVHRVFLAGYSQGGHAAMATAQQWGQLPESVKLSGVVQYAGAVNVEALFLESPWLASYLVDSYQNHYGETLDPQLVLQDRWLIPMAKNNAELCVNAAYSYYPHDPSKIYNPAFADAIETHVWPANLDAWQKTINLNTPATNLPDVPYLSIQGETDPIVTAKTQRENVTKLCQEHKRVTYRQYPGINHFQIRQSSFIFSNDWMKSVSLNNLEILPSDCSN